MSLRLIRKTSQDHPATDERFILRMMLAEGEGDPNEDDGNESEEDEDSDDEDDSGEKPDKSKSLADEEYQKLLKRMKAADKRATAAEQRLKELDDADKSELEKASARVIELEAANEELSSKLSQLRRERLFLGSNTVTWHDPEIAMSKLDWDSLVDEDGDVSAGALEKAIKDLAKNKSFLVKSDDPSDEGQRPPAQGQPSGTQAGTGKKKSKEQIDREKLLKKYPALR